MKSLDEEFKIFKKIPFPTCPEDEKYDDWFPDFVELDSYYASQVTSLLAGEKINIDKNPYFQLEKEFEILSQEDENQLYIKEIKKYLKSLKKIVGLLP